MPYVWAAVKLKKHFGLSPPEVGYILTKNYSGSTPGLPARKQAGHCTGCIVSRWRKIGISIYANRFLFRPLSRMGVPWRVRFQGRKVRNFLPLYENVAKLVRLPTFNRKTESSSLSILTIYAPLAQSVRAAVL